MGERKPDKNKLEQIELGLPSDFEGRFSYESQSRYLILYEGHGNDAYIHDGTYRQEVKFNPYTVLLSELGDSYVQQHLPEDRDSEFERIDLICNLRLGTELGKRFHYLLIDTEERIVTIEEIEGFKKAKELVSSLNS